MNRSGYFSLKVSRGGEKVIKSVFIQDAFCTSKSLYSFFSLVQFSSIAGVL